VPAEPHQVRVGHHADQLAAGLTTGSDAPLGEHREQRVAGECVVADCPHRDRLEQGRRITCVATTLVRRSRSVTMPHPPRSARAARRPVPRPRLAPSAIVSVGSAVTGARRTRSLTGRKRASGTSAVASVARAMRRRMLPITNGDPRAPQHRVRGRLRHEITQRVLVCPHGERRRRGPARRTVRTPRPEQHVEHLSVVEQLTAPLRTT
jgi:hypothetical protein